MKIKAYTANDGTKVGYEIDRPDTDVNNLRHNVVTRITQRGRYKALTDKAHKHLLMEFFMQTREGRKEVSEIIEEEAGGTSYLSIIEGNNIRLIIEDVKPPNGAFAVQLATVEGRHD